MNSIIALRLSGSVLICCFRIEYFLQSTALYKKKDGSRVNTKSTIVSCRRMTIFFQGTSSKRVVSYKNRLSIESMLSVGIGYGTSSEPCKRNGRLCESVKSVFCEYTKFLS